jgi:hypothetical protein
MKKIFILTAGLTLLFSSTLFSKPVSTNVADDHRIKELSALSKDISSIKEELENTKNPKEISDLTAKLKDAEAGFDDMATDTDLFYPDEEPPVVPKDLWQELEEVLKPLVQSLKRASEKPRKIEQLKNNIYVLDQKVTAMQKGLNKIDSLLQKDTDSSVLEMLRGSRARILKAEQNLKGEQDALNAQLEEELKSDRSFWYTSSEIMGDFFASKGKNLLYSFIVALAVFGIMLLLKKFVIRPIFCNDRFCIINRPLMALYGVVSFIVSIIAGIFCLFLLNDWFLFSITIIALGLIIWGFKHLVVDLFSAVKIIFDLGTVREGQRILLEGCPWLVKRIGLQTVLYNEALQGGEIRMGINRIKDLASRVVVKDEPWFPTRHGDHVMLADGTYGKVIVQTPEQVVVMMRGETKKYYSTPDFLKQQPRNLSSGFEVHTSIDISYDLQSKLHDVIKVFRTGLVLAMREHKLGSKIQRKGISVQFGGALESSLNIIVEVRFKGELAPYYYELKREIDSMLVLICTERKYNIPFKQVSVHVSN